MLVKKEFVNDLFLRLIHLLEESDEKRVIELDNVINFRTLSGIRTEEELQSYCQRVFGKVDLRQGSSVDVRDGVVEKYLMNRELGFGRRLLQILEEEGVSYEHMPSGVDSQCIVIKEQYLSKDVERRVVQTIKRELQPDFVTVERDFTMLMIVGEGMCYTPGMLAKACLALASAGISMSMVNQGSNEVSFMIAIRSKDRDSAVQALYKAFFS